MNHTICDTILRVLTFLGILLWAWGVYQMKFIRIHYRLILSLVSSIISLCLLACFDLGLSSELIWIILQFIIFLLLMDGRNSKKIIIFSYSITCLFVISMLINAIALSFMIHTYGYRKESFLLDLVTISISILIVLFLSYQIKKHTSWIISIQRIKKRFYFLGMLFNLTFGGVYILATEITSTSSNKIQIAFTLSLALFTCFFWLLGFGCIYESLQSDRHRIENMQKDEYLQLAKQQFSDTLKQMEEIRRIRHDFQAHINSIDYLLKKGKINDLSGYMEQLKSSALAPFEEYVDVNHELVNFIIMQGIRSARHKVYFSCTGYLPDACKISDFDLCIIFSNLISNAVNACERLSYTKRSVFLTIKCFHSNLIIYLENPVEWEIKTDSLGRSSKIDLENEHGYGLINVCETVRKNKGQILFSTHHNLFMVEITFSNIA